MTEKESKKDVTSEKKVFGEARGKYSLIDSTKVYSFEFPLSCSLPENYAAISYLRNEIFKAMEEQKKKEDQENKEKTTFSDKVEEVDKDCKKLKP